MADKTIPMNLDDVKPFTEMTSTELFIILTGGRGVMQQMYLQKYKDTSDLVTMVHTVAQDVKGKESSI